MLLGDVLTQLGLATRADIDAALAHQRRHGGYVGAILVAIGVINPAQLATALRAQREMSAGRRPACEADSAQ
ncbi:MAG TPA: hypothetical protein VMB84_09035 [Stellaceae bacterium]|nr:hypothetical protein [Stellaceae bacterium]